MSSSPHPVADILGELQRVFTRLRLRWFLFGAHSAILHGVARLSAAVDVTVDLGARPPRELIDAFVDAGFERRVADVDQLVERTRVLPLVHRASRIPVDVVLAGPGLEEQFFARVEPRRIGDATVPVASAEDLIAMKLLAGRPRNLDDVTEIIRMRDRNLDLPYIRATLRLLEQALDRRDLVSELDRIAATESLPPDDRS